MLKNTMALSEAQRVKRRARLIALVESLPEARAVGERHLSLEVEADDLAGCSMTIMVTAVWPSTSKRELGLSDRLVVSDPHRFHIPAYLGHRGWVGRLVGRAFR